MPETAPPTLDLLIILAHELGCALEMSYDAVEMRELWGDALDGLRETHQCLQANGLATPQVVLNVLATAGRREAGGGGSATV